MFVQVGARPIRYIDKSSPEGVLWKVDNGWQGRWSYSIPIRRALKADEKPVIRDIAFWTYRPEAEQGHGVWGAALDADEIAQAMKIRVREVDVWGEPPVTDGW